MNIENKTLIIILNWNGSQDTLDCCKSLNVVNEVNSKKADIFILDNCSESRSFDVLYEGLNEIYGPGKKINLDDRFIMNYSLASCNSFKDDNLYLLRSNVNHGFSRGCNIGAEFARKLSYENVLFLNNDTVVEKDFLTQLLIALDTNDAVIPQIRYNYNRDIIWNCGGEITRFGKRKYFHANKNFKEVTFTDSVFSISFATGCCLLFRSEYFYSIGGFSERFFFGEEDIELSLRLLKMNAKVSCNINSLIYHKVGASIQGDSEKILRKAYIHYLNRFVNMKINLGGVLWILWLIPSLLKVYSNLIKINKLSSIKALCVIKVLLKDSLQLNEVNKEKFEYTLKEGIK